MKTNYNHMTDSDKILHILDIMGAVSLETGKTAEELIGKGIEEGATQDLFTENWHGHKEGDHPWWLQLAAMSGTGSEEEVKKYDVPHLHRQKVKRMKNGRRTNVYVYWYDETYTHQKNFTGKEWNEKQRHHQEIREFLNSMKGKKHISEEEWRKQMNNDDAFLNINGRFIGKAWLIEHPDKAKELYGVWFVSHPDEYKELFGEN